MPRKLREVLVIPMLNPSVDEDEKLAISAKMNEKGERMDKELFAEQQRQLDKAEKAKDEAKQRRIRHCSSSSALVCDFFNFFLN